MIALLDRGGQSRILRYMLLGFRLQHARSPPSSNQFHTLPYWNTKNLYYSRTVQNPPYPLLTPKSFGRRFAPLVLPRRRATRGAILVGIRLGHVRNGPRLITSYFIDHIGWHEIGIEHG